MTTLDIKADLKALRDRARLFCDDDPDAETRAELEALLARSDADSDRLIGECFAGRLEFGTAGIRGVIGAGESRMNDRVVAETTAGLCAALLALVPDAQKRGICLGFDGRRKSTAFADVATEVATGAGFVVHRFEQVASTPLLAYSVVDRNAAAGIMITASHNPPEYNGYKVYWGNGAQIIPPQDVQIAQAIAAVKSVRKLPRMALKDAQAKELLRTPDGTEERYFAAVQKLIGNETDSAAQGAAPHGSDLRIVYTAMHGVGNRYALTALKNAGFRNVRTVAAQAEPDAAFPTVKFPNPEEPGAMDLAVALANETKADLVLANDPDADRLAVGARKKDGSVALLSGNETGLLFADHLLAQAPKDGKNLVLASLVSTPLVLRLAAAHGARCELTLTGFKWIANRAIELEKTEGLRMVLGFEEALGFSAGSLVRDKDGTSSAVLAARLAAHHTREGRTLFDALEALFRKHGLYESRPISITLPGADGMAKMSAVMKGLRSAPPKEVVGCKVEHIDDLEHGTGSSGTQRLTGLPPADVVVLYLAGEHRICVRPSGTEPKLKIYVDAFTTIDAKEDLDTARTRARTFADQVGAAMRKHIGL